MEKKISEQLVEFAQNSIGIPFLDNGRNSKTGWDCWGLCVSAYKKLGVDLGSYEQIDTFDSQTARNEIEEAVKQWVKIPLGEERPGDIVHLRPAHLGVVISKGKMLHVIPGSETCLVPYTNSLWSIRVLGIYRHAELS